MHKGLTEQPDLGVERSVEWRVSDAPVPYETALTEMDRQAAEIRADTGRELVWLLEHPPLYTAGTSARGEDLLAPGQFPVYQTGRGGQHTYHGPGQRVCYVMLDLQRRRPDVRRYVHDLEEWVIRALGHFNVRGERRSDRIGIWVDRGGGREDKIAAIGVRIRRWVTLHGIAINLDPDLSHFDGIVPCGIAAEQYGVTSLVDLGLPVSMSDLDLALAESFSEIFDKDV